MSKSAFQFEEYVISKCLFVNRTKSASKNFDIDIKPRGIHNESECKFQLLLDLEVRDEKGDISIIVEAIGLYSYTGNFEELENFFTLNAPAILFPYLRGFVSALTALTGQDTITLPTMNLSYLQQELKENIELINKVKKIQTKKKN